MNKTISEPKINLLTNFEISQLYTKMVLLLKNVQMSFLCQNLNRLNVILCHPDSGVA